MCFFVKDKFSPSEGFTLAELLMALMITSILFLILGSFLTNFYRNREAHKVMMELQEQTQYGMERIINGYNRGGNQEPHSNPRYGGLLWASSYHIDPNEILKEEEAKRNALDQKITECDVYPDPNIIFQDPNIAFKRIFFPDNTQNPDYYYYPKDPNYADYIGYLQKDKTLYQIFLFQDPNKEHKEQQIIPYHTGGRGYKDAPYEVEVNFWRGINQVQPPKGIDPNVIDPNCVVSVQVKMRKDELEFELHSAVILRNYAP